MTIYASRPPSFEEQLIALAEYTAQRDADVSVALGELIGDIDDMDGGLFEENKAWLIGQLQAIVTFVEDPHDH